MSTKSGTKRRTIPQPIDQETASAARGTPSSIPQPPAEETASGARGTPGAVTSDQDGRVRRGAARRGEILEAALQVFAEQGYRGGSLRLIAERVGISEAGILHHFGSKEGLLIAVLEARDAADARAQAEEDLKVRVLAQARRNLSRPGLAALYTTLAAEAIATDHPAHDFFVRHYADSVAADLDSLIAAQEAGLITAKVEISRLTRLTYAIGDGAQLQWLLDPDNVDMEALIADFLTLLAGPALRPEE